MKNGDVIEVPKGYLERMAKSANDTQVGGSHYTGAEIQPWDFIVSQGMGFLEGNIVKYVARYRAKNGRQDLLKAKHYLEKLLEVVK